MTAELNKHKSYEQLAAAEARHDNLDIYNKPTENIENHNEHKDNPAEKLESIRLTAEHHAKSKEAHNINQTNQPKHEHHYLTKRIKRDVYKHTVNDIQTHLSPTEKRFSQIVHNELIESISEVGAKTIARPSGILGGAIAMVFGGLIVLFFANRYGFEVPLSVYLFLYLVGFILFVVFELLSSPIKKLTDKNR